MGIKDLGKHIPHQGDLNELEELKQQLEDKYKLRASEKFQKRKIFKIPVRFIFDALMAQGLIPEDADYLDGHHDHHEETFAVKICSDEWEKTLPSTTCPVELMGLKHNHDIDGEDTMEFYII